MINKFCSFFVFGQNKKFLNTLVVVAVVIGFSTLFSPHSAEAAVRTASVTGNWNSTATWGGSSVPVAGDTVTINSGITVTVTANAACSSIVFTTGTNGTTTSLDINSGILLAVSGNVTITRPGTNNLNVINVGDGTLTIGGILAFSGTTGTRTSTLNINNGIVSVTGNITSAGIASKLIFSGSGTLNASSSFMSGTTGTFTPATGLINYRANGAQTVGVYNYYNLTLSGSGAKSMAAGISVTNNFSIAPTGTATASIAAGQNLTTDTLTLGGLGRINGTWGSTSSTATNKNNTYFALTTGRLTVATDSRTSQATLTAVATPSTVVYGSTSALSSTGGSGTGAVTFSVGASTGCSIVGATLSVTDANGTCDITATKAEDTSYFVTASASLPMTLSKKTLTVTGITASNKIYNQTTDATLNTGSATLVGVVGGDTVTLDTVSAVGTFASQNVGTGIVVTVSGLALSGASSGNYILTQPSTTANITTKALTVSGVTASDKIYDRNTVATLDTASATLVGVIAGDTVNLNTTSVTGAFANANVGVGKTVTISGLTISGAEATNYFLTQPTTTASITAKELTVTGITANNKVYNGTTVATLNKAGATLVGVISGDTVTLSTTNAVGTFASSEVGADIVVTITGLTISGTPATNYSLTQPSTTASILNPVPTTTSISPTSKYVGDPEFTLTVNGTNFVSTSVVNFNGLAKVTTFVNATQLTAIILASDINTAGVFNVTVTNPTPGGGISGTKTVTVNPIPTYQLAVNDISSMVVGERSAYTVTRLDNASAPVIVGTTTVYLYSDSLGAHKKFYDAPSGGNIITSINITNGNSTANVWYYDETPGIYTITASDATPSPDGGNGLIDATDFLVVNAGAVTQFNINSPGSLTAGNRLGYTVTRQDQFGNLVTSGATTSYMYSTSVSVNKKFYDSSVGGTMVNSITISNGTSTANVWYYDEIPGTYTIAASDSSSAPDSLGIVDATDSVQVVAGATTQFTLNHIASITVGDRAFYAITRLDQFGNLATTGSDTIYLYSSSAGVNKKFFDLAVGGNAITSIAIGSGNSTANVWYYDELAGTYTITASDSQTVPDSTGIVDATETLQVNAGALAQLSVNDQTSMTAGTRLAYTVTRKDQFGNLITIGVTTFNLATSGINGNQKFYNDATAGTQIFSSNIADGSSSANVWYYDELAGNVTITTSVGSGVTDAVDSIIVNPASTGQYLLNDPAIMMTAGTRLGYTVTRKDAFGNLVTAGDNTVYLYSNSVGPSAFYDAASNGNSLTSLIITNGNSQANFWYYDEAIGTPMITASDSAGAPNGATGIADVTDYVTVDQAPIVATRFVILNPTNGTVDAPIVVTVQAQDDSGNINTTYQSDVTILATGSASGGGLVDITNGVGTINISDMVAQTVNLTLSDTQLTNLNISSTQNVVFAPGAVRQFILNNPGDLVAGNNLAYTVIRKDQYDNLVTTGNNTVYLYSNSTGASNKFYDQASGGNIITEINITNGDSQANFWYYDDKVGNWSVVVSDNTPNFDGDSGIHDATDSLTVTPATTFRFILSNPGDMTANTRLGYMVSREDQFGNAVTSGVTNVNLSSNSTGAHSFYNASSAGSVITTAIIPNSSSTVSFWYFDKAPGTWIITASNNALGVTEATDSVMVSPEPIIATRFVILPPVNALMGESVTVTIEAQNEAGNIDTTYQHDVTLVVNGSATGGGLVNIINGVGTKIITDTAIETVNLSLSDTATTSLDISSTQSIIFSSLGSPSILLVAPTVVAPASNFVVSGKIYPSAVVLVTEKSVTGDQVVRETATASTAGTFNLAVPSDTAGVHIYGVTVKDKTGRLSQTKIFNADFTKLDEIIKTIFMPPTIDVARAVVTRGDFVKVIGYANPNTRIRIQIDANISYETKSDAQGAYTILINTASLGLGTHSVQARQQNTTTKKYSDPSLLRNFLVSSLSVPQADLNSDGKINAQDLSIFTGLYKKQDLIVDLNGDNKVNTTDLSIFLRAIK